MLYTWPVPACHHWDKWEADVHDLSFRTSHSSSVQSKWSSGQQSGQSRKQLQCILGGKGCYCIMGQLLCFSYILKRHLNVAWHIPLLRKKKREENCNKYDVQIILSGWIKYITKIHTCTFGNYLKYKTDLVFAYLYRNPVQIGSHR